eukprot:GGOE01023047.1.p1 GENE.GGOE01023047.1~~GGOE01023047.1.p1  ORF type:complete len:848 (-),score=300.82 GGOE01023047.1:364-2577(-)
MTKFLTSFKLPQHSGPFYPTLIKLVHTRQRSGTAPNSDINVDAQHLATFDPGLYRALLKYPAEIIIMMDLTLNQYYRDHLRQDPDDDRKFVVRMYNLQEQTTMRSLGPENVDSLVAIKGMVTRVSKVIPEMKAAYFRCMDCFDSVVVRPHKGRIEEPHRCTNCKQPLTYMLQHNLSEFENKQIVKLQEAPEAVPEGETPSSITVTVFDNLVDFVLPGDRVVVTGIFKAAGVRTKSTSRVLRAVFKTYVDAIHISKVERAKISTSDLDVQGTKEYQSSFEEGQPREDEEDSAITEKDEAALQRLAERPDIYQLLARSLAPSIFAMHDVKKGLLCQLFNGANKNWQRTRVRGEINILLCGDPGVAKSQLLSFVHKIAPRGIYTSGRGSSSVGLTAYVVRDMDSGETVLESGALVLSDKGICCIDEFDKMSESTKAVLHEVMEQQTVSIAKAGIIATLNARTSLLAAANPAESKWQTSLSVVENLQLEPTLISRFDLIYVLIDKVDEKLDTYLANHIVRLYQAPDQADQTTGNDMPRRARRHTVLYGGEEIIPLELLTKYISYARKKVNPAITEEAHSDLVNNYVELRRQRRGDHTVSATTRQLESLIRLSEALAKMRLSSVVERVDVQEAYRLMTDSLRQSAINPLTGRMDMGQLFGGVDSSLSNSESLTAKLQKYLSSRQLPSTIGIGKLKQDFMQVEDIRRDIPRWQFMDILKMAVNTGHLRSINTGESTVTLPIGR